jgi:hypothetical protein
MWVVICIPTTKLIDASFNYSQRKLFYPVSYPSAVEAAGRRGTQEYLPGDRAGVQRGPRIDAVAGLLAG